MAYLLLVIFPSLFVGLSSGTFSLFLPERLPQDYIQQQESSNAYWPDTGASQDYSDDSGGFRYHQSYQTSYRQQIQHSVPYPSQHPNSVYQQLPPPSAVPTTYQLADPEPVPHTVLRSGGLPTTSLPVFQLVTIGPEVPVLVRLPNQETAILPVRTVYSLPSFLESIVQRVQNYYSVYNPLEVLKVPRENVTQQAVGENSTTTQASTAASDSSPTTTTAGSGKVVATLKAVELPSTTTEVMEDSTTDSNTISVDSTTVQ